MLIISINVTQPTSRPFLFKFPKCTIECESLLSNCFGNEPALFSLNFPNAQSSVNHYYQTALSSNPLFSLQISQMHYRMIISSTKLPRAPTHPFLFKYPKCKIECESLL